MERVPHFIPSGHFKKVFSERISEDICADCSGCTDSMPAFFYLCTELKHRFVYGAGIALRDAVEWDMD